jgi:hypothetical protein
LKAKTAPRHLTSEQEAAIFGVLSRSPPGSATFVSRLMDGEGSDFAKEIGQIFQEAKWTVTGGSSFSYVLTMLYKPSHAHKTNVVFPLAEAF